MDLLDGKEILDRHLMDKIIKELIKVLSQNNISYRSGIYYLSMAIQQLEDKRDDMIISVL